MAAIKNIIFDLGNVIIDLDLEATDRQLEHLIGPDYNQLRERSEVQRIFLDYEVGAFDETVFIERLRGIAGRNIGATDLIEAWNAMLLGIPAKRFEMLEQLRSEYKVFLLSNTNATHVVWVDRYLQREHGLSIAEFDDRFFDKPYYSHLIRERKPDLTCYEKVLKDGGMEAEQTLFIDDNRYNIEGAAKLGIQTCLHPIGSEITDLIVEYLP